MTASSIGRRIWQASAVLVASLMASCHPAPASSPLTCRVLIDGQPAAVQLTLCANAGDKHEQLLVGVADSSGSIVMHMIDGKQLPKQADLELRAVVESIGAGDWTIASPWNDPTKTPLKVKWPRNTNQVDIQLPKNAIKPI